MCYCDIGDYDPPEFYAKDIVTARKQHRCDECCRTIERGDIYERAVGKWEGNCRTFKMCDTCLTCLNLVRGMHEDDKEEFCRPPHGGLWEFFHECDIDIFARCDDEEDEEAA